MVVKPAGFGPGRRDDLQDMHPKITLIPGPYTKGVRLPGALWGPSGAEAASRLRPQSGAGHVS